MPELAYYFRPEAAKGAVRVPNCGALLLCIERNGTLQNFFFITPNFRHQRVSFGELRTLLVHQLLLQALQSADLLHE